MTDTHTHLYLPEFSEDGHEAVVRARAAGVGMLVLPCVDISSVDGMLALNARCPDCTRLAFALHPTEVGEDWKEEMSAIMENISCPACVAVGETGIDLYWDATCRERQMEAFAAHLDIAGEHSLPVIIHCRQALDETLEVIGDHIGRHGGCGMPLVFHSFTGSPADVERIRSVCDPWFGINGVVTFRNAGELSLAVPSIGVGRILLETDSPYLAPVPRRGRRNESSYLPYIRDKVASLLGITPEEAEAATDRNASAVFRLNICTH